MEARGFAIYTRDNRRFPARGGPEAWVEFEIEGDRWRFPLVDISFAGLAFELPSDAPAVEPGHELSPMLVRVGDHSAHVRFFALHVTNEFDARTACGGRIRPTTDAEEARLLAVIAELDRSAGRVETSPGTGSPSE